MRRTTGGVAALLMVCVIGAACAGAAGGPPAADATLPAPPWSGAPLNAATLPDAYTTAWSAAANRESCALVAPASVEPAHATARRATFSGGWGVAYDLPELRSAFGVAGTGATPDDGTYDEGCLYNVWSRLGVEHLEGLLGQLRFVEP